MFFLFPIFPFLEWSDPLIILKSRTYLIEYHKEAYNFYIKFFKYILIVNIARLIIVKIFKE